MTAGRRYWDDAPCGLLTLAPDGTILDANATMLGWVGRDAAAVLGAARISELLTVGGRMYWETHLSPLLLVERRLDEVLLEVRGPGGRLPVLLDAVVSEPRDGADEVIHVSVSRAVERNRFERELVATRNAAERSASHVRALQHVTAALSRAVGVAAVAEALLTATVGPVGAAAGTLWLADTAGALAWQGSRGEPAAAAVAAPVGAVDPQRGAQAADGRVLVPLTGHAALQGLLSLTAREDPAADPLDLEVLTAVGQQAGLALDRARTYEHNADVARELQHSLLAVPPPEDVRFAVDAAYRPGVETLEVGGDWHDAFFSSPGVLSVVVGDVVGRGLVAASAMGQLRSAVRAVAGADTSPGQLLARLDRFVERVDAAAMATVAYGDLDVTSGLLRYACAGHPPPLLLPADGEPRLLWDGRSTPLGAFLRPSTRPEAQVRLSPGDRVVLYTDGLVERRARPIDHGLQRLVSTAATLASASTADVVQQLTEVMLDDEHGRDDVCVLLLCWYGEHFDRELPASLQGLSALRHALGAWLAEQGVDPAVARDVVLATSESVANAAEHGSGLRHEESVRVSARIERRAADAADVVVFVRDRGRWRIPAPSAERGRGLLIVRRLVDDVRVTAGEGTTVQLRRSATRYAT